MIFLGNNTAPSCSEVCNIFDFNARDGRYRPNEIGSRPLNHMKRVWEIGITTHIARPNFDPNQSKRISEPNTTCSPSLYYKILN